MSFILDALKKSESDRQRQSGPSLFEVKVAPPRRRLPVWAAAIAVLLGINAVVVSWMLLRHAPAPAAAPAPATAPAARPAPSPGTRAGIGHAASGQTPPRVAASAAPAATRSEGSVPPVMSASSASSTADEAAPAAPLASDAGQSAGPVPAAEGASSPAVGAPTAAPQDPAASDGGGALPLYQQVVGSDGLPQLHLDLHVFAKRPQDRFVMINMHRLGEGDSLPDGVHVEAIRPDGVVLSWHGTRFLLPRD